MKKWTRQSSKALQNPFRKFWRSAINRRLVSAASRLGIACLFLVMVVGIESVPGTNAFFSSVDSIGSNAVMTGWWIPPTVSISSPLVGNEWQVGSSHTIHWSAASADPAATAGMLIDIDFKCGSGAWVDIAMDTANDGSYVWTVEPTISDNCFIRVTATDSHGLISSDESDQFAISWMVALNEFLPNPPGIESGPKPDGEWVELYNYGDEAVDVSGWHLYDALDHDLPIAASHTNTGNTIVPAHGWLVMYRDGDADFSLNNDGDTIKLYDGSSGSGGNEIDLIAYGATTEGKTWARVPDGTGAWADPVPTPGEKNDPSNDVEDMKKYYAKVCFDEHSNPLCDQEFLKELGLSEPAETAVIAPVLDQALSEPSGDLEDQTVPADDPKMQTDETATETVTDTAPQEILDTPEEDVSSSEDGTEVIGTEEMAPPAPEASVEPEEDKTTETKAVPSDEPVVKEPETEDATVAKDEPQDEKAAEKSDTAEKKDDGEKGKETSSDKVENPSDDASSETSDTAL